MCIVLKALIEALQVMKKKLLQRHCYHHNRCLMLLMNILVVKYLNSQLLNHYHSHRYQCLHKSFDKDRLCMVNNLKNMMQ